MYTVSWNDFSYYVELPCERQSDDQILCPVEEVDNTLSDNDHIWFKEENGSQFGLSPSEIEIVLTSAANVTYSKEIKAFNSQGKELGWIQTRDAAHGPVSMRLDAASVNSLIFSKGKIFNILTAMYQVFDVTGKEGKRLTFEWKSD